MMIFINEIITPSTKSARSFFDEKTGTVLGGRKTGTVLEEKNWDGPGRKTGTVLEEKNWDGPGRKKLGRSWKKKIGTVLEEKNGDGPEGRKGRTVPKKERRGFYEKIIYVRKRNRRSSRQIMRLHIR
ncbi:MAG TPA: hypothetical protein OIM49_01230 [Clostridiaceae bacterium]|jgi:hypothetical protein|nr:hypothetical protein [Clostridiaceae bacterium]